MDSWDTFKAPLPPKEAFYSSLRNEHITDAQYEHAKAVWQKHDCRNMADYHDIYLLSDVVLLADVFQSFRKMCLSYYGLDPGEPPTWASMTLAAILKITFFTARRIRELSAK